MTRGVLVLVLGLVASACDRPAEAKNPHAPQPATALPSASTMSSVATVVLTIEGMVCQGCAEAARDALEQVPGVVQAEVDLQQSAANVTFDPTQAAPDDLTQALQQVDRDPAPSFRVTHRRMLP